MAIRRLSGLYEKDEKGDQCLAKVTSSAANAFSKLPVKPHIFTLLLGTVDRGSVCKGVTPKWAMSFSLQNSLFYRALPRTQHMRTMRHVAVHVLSILDCLSLKNKEIEAAETEMPDLRQIATAFTRYAACLLKPSQLPFVALPVSVSVRQQCKVSSFLRKCAIRHNLAAIWVRGPPDNRIEEASFNRVLASVTLSANFDGGDVGLLQAERRSVRQRERQRLAATSDTCEKSVV